MSFVHFPWLLMCSFLFVAGLVVLSRSWLTCSETPNSADLLRRCGADE